MNYYTFHIGDYMTATRRLSWEEDIAYRRMIDAYYIEEAPLPTDKREVYRMVQAVTRVQKAAVDYVLATFFTLTDAGHQNSRCDKELSAFTTKRAKARQSAEARWASSKQSDGNANADANASPNEMRTHSEGNAPISHHPSPITQVDEMGTGASLEKRLREAAGWQFEGAPKLLVTGAIEELIRKGADLELDILPIVRALAPQVGSRTSWNYFLKPIQQAVDSRKEIVNGTHVNGTAAGSRQQHRPSAIDVAASRTRAALDEREREIEAREAEDRERAGH